MTPGALRAWLIDQLDRLDKDGRAQRSGDGRTLPYSRPRKLELAGMKVAYSRVLILLQGSDDTAAGER